MNKKLTFLLLSISIIYNAQAQHDSLQTSLGFSISFGAMKDMKSDAI